MLRLNKDTFLDSAPLQMRQEIVWQKIPANRSMLRSLQPGRIERLAEIPEVLMGIDSGHWIVPPQEGPYGIGRELVSPSAGMGVSVTRLIS